MPSKPTLIALITLCVLSSSPLSADDTKPLNDSPNPGDPRVHRVLKANDLKYRVDDDGDFRVILRFDDDRSQLVFINSSTQTLDGMEIREVWSMGYRDGETIPAHVVKDLMLHSSAVKLGAWELVSGKREVAVFTAKVNADQDAEAFDSTLWAVARSADKKEKEHLTTDEL